MAYSKAQLKSNGDRASPCFKPFLTITCRILAYQYSAIRFIQTHFSVQYYIHGYVQLNGSNIEDIHLNLIISRLEVYKELMHCFVLFPFFLKYFKNESNENLKYLYLYKLLRFLILHCTRESQMKALKVR